MKNKFLLATLAIASMAAACSDPSRPAGPGAAAKIFVDSDPRGATIFVDGTATTQVTPDTLRNVSDSDHDIGAQITKSGINYLNSVHVTRGALPTAVLVPVIARCGTVQCINSATTYATTGTFKFGVSPLG